MRDFVAGVVERSVPYLGVCLGGQLLAQASGEVVNEAIVNYFEALFAAGGFFEGATDQTLRTLRVAR